MSEIKWHIGKPHKKGFYITTRIDKTKNNKPYVIFNTYGFYKDNDWDSNVLDNSVTIAWALPKDITPFTEK